MGRLIREDDVMRMLTGVELNNGTITDAKIELRNVKTAYDITKVVAELEENSYTETVDDMDPYSDIPKKVVRLERTIDIARKGGVE